MNIINSSIYNIFYFFNKKIYVKFFNDWYNIYELQKLHPNGENIFWKYHMKDISLVFRNNLIHNQIKDPKKILEKYKIIDKKLIMKLDEQLISNNL